MPLWWSRASAVKAEHSAAQMAADADLPADVCPNKKYTDVKALGFGSFGQVIAVEEQATGKHFAVKKLPRCSFKPCHQSEILIQRQLNHPHIIKLHEVCLTAQHVCMVMDLANGGNMFDFVLHRGCLEEGRARWFFQQLILAVDYCHAKGVANRDIKLENLLLQYLPGMRQPLLRLCDFGHGKELDANPCSTVGTFGYMAPEVLANHNSMQRSSYDARAAELWSCGVVLYTMLVGQYPFEHEPCRLPQTLRTMQQQCFSLPEQLSDDCRDMLGALLHPDPAKRITIEGIKQHPWFLQDLPAAALEMTERYLPVPPKCQQSEAELLALLAEVYIQQDLVEVPTKHAKFREADSRRLGAVDAVATLTLAPITKQLRAAA